MSEDLIDIRSKIPRLLDEIIEAEAQSRGEDKSYVIREVLQQWGRVRHRFHIELQRRLESPGNCGESQGGRGRQSDLPKRRLSWEDE